MAKEQVDRASREVESSNPKPESPDWSSTWLELAYDAIMVCNIDGVISYWNHGAELLYGWPKDQAIGAKSGDLLRTIFPVPMEQIATELERTGKWEGELRHTVRNGDMVVVSSRWNLRVDGAHREILEINRDIT